MDERTHACTCGARCYDPGELEDHMVEATGDGVPGPHHPQGGEPLAAVVEAEERQQRRREVVDALAAAAGLDAGDVADVLGVQLPR